ncbi:hypothetical protein [Maritalea porphyrae]|uniref:Squalene cyclase C-terminal domain-containing protein n=1 Tax=Maritalea porphyrae TaxID=880732 RepID=A0ABQ5USE9_9HYPH|nr:hypothetical protein [Maritalea porphyrae]GLQ18118.1 hypothetical protein GCM10007879_23670 [Maritalea porphyrae]
MLTRVALAFLVLFYVSVGAARSERYLPYLDQHSFAIAPKAVTAIAVAFLPAKVSPLLGRNRKWGAMFSPRFQVGAGYALRVSLQAKNNSAVLLAFGAIKEGATAIDKNGAVNSSLPPEIAAKYKLKRQDLASAAAFYLGDACLAIAALREEPKQAQMVGLDSLADLEGKLVRAANWLLSEQHILLVADKKAPNRLLFDALAFYSCGKLADDKDMQAAAVKFVSNAIELLRPDGSFEEGGGTDTSYQAVAVRVGFDLISAGYDPERLAAEMEIAVDWLIRLIDRSGRLNSSQNSRTCGGDESFIGQPKNVAITEVFRAVLAAGVYTNDEVKVEKAKLLAAYYGQKKNQLNPCG